MMEKDIALDLEIRGEVSYLARKHHLTEVVTADIHKLFCEQARRWEAKIVPHAERIHNQRKEIAMLHTRIAALKQDLEIWKDSAQHDA